MSIKNYFIGFSHTSVNETYFSKYYKIGSFLFICGMLIFNENILNRLYAAELKYQGIGISVTELSQLVKVNLNLKDTYYFEYYKIAIFMLLAAVICSLLILIAYLFSLTTVKDSEKLSEYECGFEPFDNATRHPFDVHFYIVGILFLIFDVEIALIFPWVMALEFIGWFGFLNMIIFLTIVTIGFFYEWHRGALSWPQIPENSLQ